jgi:hypothetical protein
MAMEHVIYKTNATYKANDNDTNSGKYITAQEVDRIADYLVEQLQSPTSRPFYCLVAWNLPENLINAKLKVSLANAMNPGGYFNMIINKEMAKITTQRASGSKLRLDNIRGRSEW